jgi:hypothetical protein
MEEKKREGHNPSPSTWTKTQIRGRKEMMRGPSQLQKTVQRTKLWVEKFYISIKNNPNKAENSTLA